MSQDSLRDPGTALPWAMFRLSVVGPLLASPPGRGELREALDELAARTWRHPVTGQPIQYRRPTIEQWYYQAKSHPGNPLEVLSRKIRSDRGRFSAITDPVAAFLRDQYQQWPEWSHDLHYANLIARLEKEPGQEALPSYATVRRFRIGQGMIRRKKPRNQGGAPLREVLLDPEPREVLSFEAEHVNALWHLDFHHGSRKIPTADGEWVTPVILAIMDDHSRLICHAQWYLSESAENLVHGLIQAFLKRDFPQSLMSDNGSAMTAGETTQGLKRLGVLQVRTLAGAPHQNGKQENFWAQVEGRLMSMLLEEPFLTLEDLNVLTHAWIEGEYHKRVNQETGQSPLRRYLDGRNVGRRPVESAAQLRECFGVESDRMLRRSDGTISVEGRRYQVPLEYRHLDRVRVRYALWDLSQVHLVDRASGVIIGRIAPVDRHRNADGRRRKAPRRMAAAAPPQGESSRLTVKAALMSKLLEEFRSSGLPPPYLRKDEEESVTTPPAVEGEGSRR